MFCLPLEFMNVCALSLFSRIRLFVILWTVACQASRFMGFSRQEYWSGLPCFPPGDLPYLGIESGSPKLQADSLLSESPGKPLLMFYSLSCVCLFVTPWTVSHPWDSPAKKTGVDSHFLLQGIFLTQGLNLGLLHCRWILYFWATREVHTNHFKC